MSQKLMPEMEAIKLSSLSFSYPKKDVLQKISMEIKPGTFTVVVGPNGAGKSTLLKCSNQLLKGYSGDVKLGDINLMNLRNYEISRYIGYVPQNYQTLFSMTVFDSLLLGLERRSTLSYSKAELMRVSQIMDQFDLADMANKEIDHLSGGQQQRVTIARALVKEPPFLFMDEPTSGLDIKTQRDVMFFLKRLTRTKNIGVLTIIHDINLAAELADKIVVLKDGNLLAKGKPEEVVVPEVMKDAFGVKNEVIFHQGNPHLLILNEGIS